MLAATQYIRGSIYGDLIHKLKESLESLLVLIYSNIERYCRDGCNMDII